MTTPGRPAAGRRSRCAAAALAVALLLAGCATPAPSSVTGPPASAAPSLPATPVPTPTIEPVPTVRPWPSRSGPLPEPDSLPTSAVAADEDVRLTLAVANNPVGAGGATGFTVTIENIGSHVLEWMNSGCDQHAGVSGLASGSWAPGDADIAAELEPYREWLLEDYGIGSRIGLRTTTLGGLGRNRGGCADLGIPYALAPGESVAQVLVWDGQAGVGWGLPPSGPAAFTATFDRWRRAGEPEGEGAPGRSIAVDMEVEIIGGRRSDALSPLQVVDAALGDDRLASWLLTRPLRSGANTVVAYDPVSGLWTVGLLVSRDRGDADTREDILHAAFVDPITGEVIDVRELPAQL